MDHLTRQRTLKSWPSVVEPLVCLATAAAAVSVIVPAESSAASIGGFSVRPARFNPGDAQTRAFFKPVVSAGRRFGDAVVVTNPGSAPVELDVYGVDGVTGVTSGAVYANRSDPLRGAGAWIRPSVTQLTVRPHTERQVTFTVDVPRSAAPGDHLAGIAIEGASPQRSAGKFSVTVVVRAVVGVLITVRGSAQPQLQLKGISLAPLPGTRVPSAVIALANTGGKLCKPTLEVTLSQSSAPAQTVTRQLDTILPGDEIRYPMQWSQPLAAGAYTATVLASHCGSPRTLSAGIDLGHAITGNPAVSQAAALRPQSTSGTPWWLFAVVGGGGVGAGLALSRRGRGRRGRGTLGS